MSDIPEEVRHEVIREVYRCADGVDWDGLGQAERTGWYNRWLDEQEIGGVILKYMPRERARGWLKDVPMKHYRRARSGLGPYAPLASQRFPGPAAITRQVFGMSWDVVPSSIKEKPNRCKVSDGERQYLMIWGPASQLSALIWAGINAVVDREPLPILVLTSMQGQHLSSGDKSRHVTLGRQAGLDVVHTELREGSWGESSRLV